eukprot:scaffold896_cov172-Amphora_coffeaeformis.AAC.18
MMMSFVQRRRGSTPQKKNNNHTFHSTTMEHIVSSRSRYSASARRSLSILARLTFAVLVLLAIVGVLSEDALTNKLWSTLQISSNAARGTDAKAIVSSHLAKDANVTLLNEQYGSSVGTILDWVCSKAQQGERIVQLTSFGASSLVILDKLKHREDDCLHRIPVVFIDTLHLFPETYKFLNDVVMQRKDYGIEPKQLRVYQPKGFKNRDEFDERFGKDLYKVNPSKYGMLTKIEPTQRALDALHAQAWITGRRRSQGAERASLEAFERDGHERLKINPLVDWTYEQVWDYIQKHNLPYNPLFNQGYKSIGDVQTTFKVAPDAAERSGRFQGLNQTECGMHEKDKEKFIDSIPEMEQYKPLDPYRGGKDFLELNAQTLDELVLDEEHASSSMLLVFFSPLCGHCRHFMPTFMEVAHYLQRFGSSIKAARFNVRENRIPDRAKEAGLRVAGVPTVFLVQHKPFRVAKFMGGRDKDSILEWLKENGAIGDTKH